jgi:hypothetical protein
VALDFELPERWRHQWKLKIRDFERNEPPHVTLMKRTRAWRWNIRDGGFMDRDPPPREVPVELVEELKSRLAEIRTAWDAVYPENPVSSKGGDDV